MEENAYQALCAGPKVVERIIRVFPKERFDEKDEVNRFTPREVIAHLADFELQIQDRIRVAHRDPGATVELTDPSVRAREHHFEDKNVFHEAEVFESRRSTTVEYLRDLKEEEFENTFTLSNGATVSIKEFVSQIIMHDMYYLEQLSEHLATEVATLT